MIRQFYKKLKINYLNLLSQHLLIINYSKNIVLKKKYFKKRLNTKIKKK